MVIYYGTKLFGKVDRVPGIGFVATRFFHVQGFPLFPLGSYAVHDGSDGTPGAFLEIPLGLRLKSVLAGYLRASFAMAALSFGTLGLLEAIRVMAPPPAGSATPAWHFLAAFAGVIGAFAAFLKAPAPFWCLGWLGVLAVSGYFVRCAGGLPRDILTDPHRDAWLGLIVTNAAIALDAMVRPFLRAGRDAAHELGVRLQVSPKLVSAALAGERVDWRDEHRDARPAAAPPTPRMDPLDEPTSPLGFAAGPHGPAPKPPAAADDWPEFALQPGKGPKGKSKAAEPSTGSPGDLVRIAMIGLGLSAGVLLGAFAVSADRQVEAWESKVGPAPTLKLVLDLHRMGGRGMVYQTLISAAGFGFGMAAIGLYSLVTSGARARAEAARRNPPVAWGWSDVGDPAGALGPGPSAPEDAEPIVGPDGPIGGWAAPGTATNWPSPHPRLAPPFAAPGYGSQTLPAGVSLPGMAPSRKPSDLGQRQAPIELIGGAVGLLLLGLFTYFQLSWLELVGGETKVWWGIAAAYKAFGKEAAVAVCAVPGVLLLIRAVHRIATD